MLVALNTLEQPAGVDGRARRPEETSLKGDVLNAASIWHIRIQEMQNWPRIMRGQLLVATLCDPDASESRAHSEITLATNRLRV